MGRGRYPARLNVAPPPPEIAARYLHIWPGRELYSSPETFPAVSSRALFGDNRPLELDIGCATGDLVLALAALRPEANYVGVDIVGKPIWRAVERAVAAGRANVRFVQADTRLVYRLVPDGALRAAYVHFPAPLLSNRQRKQLLISPALLAQMGRCLMPGGLLSVLTDQRPLFDELHAILPGAPALRLVPPEQWSVSMTELVKSHYHRRWEARGRQIFRAELVRQ
ncbi:MAG: methyltransferase domain-containing protein [Chloroflexales bacterium]|nr:methyltransferase domain-containing protein [Chloroflexales bacterium]